MNYKTRKALKNEMEMLVAGLDYENEDDYKKRTERIKEIETILNTRKYTGIDPNVVITGLISIGTALLVLNYEKTDILISKAWNERIRR